MTCWVVLIETDEKLPREQVVYRTIKLTFTSFTDAKAQYEWAMADGGVRSVGVMVQDDDGEWTVLLDWARPNQLRAGLPCRLERFIELRTADEEGRGE